MNVQDDNQFAKHSICNQNMQICTLGSIYCKNIQDIERNDQWQNHLMAKVNQVVSLTGF